MRERNRERERERKGGGETRLAHVQELLSLLSWVLGIKLLGPDSKHLPPLAPTQQLGLLYAHMKTLQACRTSCFDYSGGTNPEKPEGPTQQVSLRP